MAFGLVQFVQGLPGFKETSRTKIDSPPGYLVEGEASIIGVNTLFKLVVTINDEYGIVGAFFVRQPLQELHQPILDKMLASFQIYPPLVPPTSDYSNERLGISFSYPANWTIDASDPTVIRLDPGFGSFVLVLSLLTGPTTLDAQLSQFLTEFSTNTGFQELSRTTITGDSPGYLISIEWSVEDTPVRGDFMLRVSGARTYSIGFLTLPGLFDQHQAEFGLGMDSFEVTLPPTAEPIDASAPLEDTLDAIGERVTGIRGLPSLTSLERGLQSRDEFKAEAAAEEPDEEKRLEIELLKEFCTVLDLCSETDDLLGASKDITGKGILGYYQIDEKILTAVIDEEQLEPRGWLIYAHEYTHALQDQQFDLSMILEPGDDGFDIIKAVRALMEGDANFTQFLFYESLPQEQQALLAKELEGDIEEFSRSQEVTQAPRIIRETFGWEHGAGPGFVFRLYLEGGFDAINEAYQNLPQSTEQVLHPEKYLAGEEPHTVELPELASALGNGWQQRDTGVLGELRTRIYLGTFLSEDQADGAATGWGGDRYALMKDAQDRLLIAMRFSWDTVEDAEEFFRAYLDLADEKSQGQWETIRAEENERLWEGEDIAVYLSLEGAGSTVIIGPNRATVEAVRDEVSKGVPTANLEPAPNIQFSLYQGEEVLGARELSVSDLRGKPVVLIFWGGLCPPCRAQLPDLQEFYDEYGGRVTILGLDIGPFIGLGSAQDGRELLVELDISYPAGSTPDETVVKEYEIIGMPSTFFITADGKIFRKWTGPLNKDKLVEIVEEMLALSGSNPG